MNLHKALSKKVDNFFIVSLFFISLIPALSYLHLVEDDFANVINLSDGFLKGLGVCSWMVTVFAGNDTFLGLTSRPPLIPIILSVFFKIFGHNLLAIYLTYLIPRLLILPLIYLILRRYFLPIVSFLGATITLFILFFETYAVSTLKLDVFVVMFSLASVYLYLRWKKSQKPSMLFITGICIVLNILTKENGVPFSLALIVLILINISIKKNKLTNIVALFFPILLFLLPYVIESFVSTGRFTRSFYTTKIDIAFFPQNIKTYLLSVAYYLGINFDLSKLNSLFSVIKVLIFSLGIFYILKKKYLELILPAFAIILGISLYNPNSVQGDIIGNREILHRISPLVPFLVILMIFGCYQLTKISRFWLLKHKKISLLLVIFLLEAIFFFQYFRSPFALDYNSDEFYVNFASVLAIQKEIPMTNFSLYNGSCIVTGNSYEKFLLDNYREYRVSAFPPYYKITLLLSIMCVFFIGIFLIKDKGESLPSGRKFNS